MPIESCMSDLPPAILFDLDGTLIDSAPDLSAALNHTLRTLDIPEVPEESVRHMVGYGARRLIEQGIEAALIEMDDGEIEAALRIFLDWYREHLADRTRPFEGVIDALDTLQAAQMPMAVCTNKPHHLAVPLLDALGVASLFDAIVGTEPEKPIKPDPTPYTKAVTEAGGAVEQSLLIGDTATDRKTSTAAGVPSVLVTFSPAGKSVLELFPDETIDHFDALDAVVEKLLG